MLEQEAQPRSVDGRRPHTAMADVGVDLLEGLGIPPQKHPELWASVYTVDPDRPVMVFPIQSLLSIFNECPDPALPGTVALRIFKAIHDPVYGGFVLLPRLNAREETARLQPFRRLVEILGKIVAASMIGAAPQDRDAVCASTLNAASAIFEHLETTVCCMTPGVTPHGPVDPARIPGTEWVRDAVDAMIKTAVGSNPRFPDTWAQKTTKTLGTAVAQAAWALSIFANRIRRELDNDYPKRPQKRTRHIEGEHQPSQRRRIQFE